MTTIIEQPPADPDAWVWAASGHLDAAYESVQDASDRTRAEARARYARDIGERFIDVSVWRRHARALDRQERWEWHCDQREDDPDGPDGAEREMPATPPDGWQPDPWDEDAPCWEFCLPDDDGAVPVWVCGPRGSRPPYQPRRVSQGQDTR